MSDPQTVVRFDRVGKMYKVFGSKRDNLLDSLGLQRLTRRREGRYREFWALRGVDFELKRGERLGIIGRNGAGKSTLLKLMTGNLTPSEGTIAVNGKVQALLEIGGGLHPEFTGYENINAALTHLGLSPREIHTAEREIADFTELGGFLDQPFKTYSLGMQARLSFAIATVIEPEILIIDEILGAGDAYFFGKSTARMQELIEGGASVLLVSHGLDQVIRFCDETIWLDRGRVAMRGPSVEVVKAYEKFIRELEDRRLVAKNRKSRIASFDAFEREGYTDYLTARVSAGEAGAVDVAEVTLLVDGEPEDGVAVGAAQDADSGQSASIVLEGSAWSSPEQEGDRYFRRVSPGLQADALFNLWFFYPDVEYGFALTYRAPAGGLITLGRSGRLEPTVELPSAPDWTTLKVDYAESDDSWRWQGGGRRSTEQPADDQGSPPKAHSRASERDGTRVSRWPGEGSIRIEDVVLLDAEGSEQAVFQPHAQLVLLVRARAHEAGTFRIQPVAVVFRMDGILVSNLVGDPLELELEAGDPVEFRLTLDDLNLGDGRYVTSVALYRELSPSGISVSYDLIDRSYEFEVVGSHPFDNGVFRHGGSWTVERPAAERLSRR